MLTACFCPTFHRVLCGLLLLAGSFVSGRSLGATQGGPLADSIDLRPAFEKWQLARRVQGKRNTCSVFTVTGAIEYAMASQTGHTPRLSVEFLNWASNQAAHDADDGSFFSDLWRGFSAYGACPEEDMPYQDTFDASRAPSDQAKERARQLHGAGLRLHWIKLWDPNTGLTDREVVAIKRVLNRHWPVCGGFRWPKKVRRQDDVLGMEPPEGVFDGHSVLLVGYRDDPQQPGGGMFLFRNSNNNGRDGWMTYEYARAYMNDAVWIDDEPDHQTTVADVLGPLGAWPQGRNRRVSSNQQPWHTENLDMTWLMPGESVNMPILEGPGVVTHMWFTSHAGWVGELNALVLRIYYDDSKEPGVEVPLGDFFAVGHGKPASVESVPVQVSPTGSLTCYWRMPFRKSARIVVTNDNPDRSTGLYWQVDWMQLDDLPSGTPYFYARYRQEYPAVAGDDYLLADLTGSGWYVGTVMSVTLGQNGWFGEGDDFFYIDGERVPSLQGTGSEDYFNDAWGFRVRTGPWFGQPRWQDYVPGDAGVCYRWHLLDPVCFSKSLRVAIEHKGNCDESEDGFFFERPDFLSSVTYWYQTGEPKTTFRPLPGWHERRVPWEQHHFVKAFRRAKTSGKAKVQVQTQGFFGARPVLLWPNDEVGATLTVPFELSQDGRFAVRLTAASGPAHGAYDIELDGKKVVTANFRASEEGETDLVLGTHELSEGSHTILFRANGGAGQVGPLGVEVLRLLKLPPEAGRVEKTHHEAHFVRLGIGRALYAHRLAFDVLPESLEVLVEKGFMSQRYLRDENNLPLKYWREGDTAFVESPGRDHWRHSWKGLDARR
ncbi:MAG TPA: DUF2961 domain-containing protein [Sedimentisphaerales bacterium]|jgi:hypothetical protein|nr:DUF2961 domain-containing protein [Sedimentisphaerales bacterium]HNU28988.1 DUF2961 domain-containing protein [Sedimentisphaerales bacterium]